MVRRKYIFGTNKNTVSFVKNENHRPKMHPTCKMGCN